MEPDVLAGCPEGSDTGYAPCCSLRGTSELEIALLFNHIEGVSPLGHAAWNTDTGSALIAFALNMTFA